VSDQFELIGKAIPKLDAVAKVTGELRYVADLQIPGVLAAKLVHPLTAHASILAVDTSAAERLPGVRAVITGHDLPQLRYGQLVKDQTFLPTDRVRYFGEPVAAVAAVDERTAEEAAALVRVDWQELPPLDDAEEALLPGAPLIHEEAGSYEAVPMTMESPLPLGTPAHGSNVLFQLHLEDGDVKAGFAQADRIFEETYSVPMVAHAAMEPHACAADWNDARVTIWTCTQTPTRIRSWAAEYFGLPPARVRVVGVKPGGGFGAKIGVVLEPYCLGLSRKARAPVRLVLTRTETFQMIGGWLPGTFRFKTGVKNDGRLVARKLDVVWNAGAHANTSPVASANAALVALGPYPAQNVQLDSRLVYTNLPGARPYRGLAATQANWAAERHIDSVARGLGLDPFEFRLRNCLKPGDATPWGEINHDVRLEECLRAAVHEIGWGRPKSDAVGRGVASMWKWTLPGFIAQVEVRLQEDGSADVYSGTVDIGTGSEVVLGQVAAEVLGLPMASVRVHMGDTDYGLEDSGAAASRTAAYAGHATLRAATAVKRQVLDLAAAEIGIAAGELELRAGRVQASAQPGTGVALPQLLAGGGVLSGRGEFRGTVHTEVARGAQAGWRFADWKFGACAVEVEVDRETGRLRVERVVVAHDIGRVLNRLNVETQAQGCVVMGLGAAIFEHQVFDGAQMVNPSFMDYVIPTALEAPGEVVPVLIESGAGHGPFGARGFGELPIVAVAAALGNAVADATGVEVRHLPISPEKILAGLDGAG
jgi:carbon-monoxide dehydrogenase large subunit